MAIKGLSNIKSVWRNTCKVKRWASSFWWDFQMRIVNVNWKIFIFLNRAFHMVQLIHYWWFPCSIGWQNFKPRSPEFEYCNFSGCHLHNSKRIIGFNFLIGFSQSYTSVYHLQPFFALDMWKLSLSGICYDYFFRNSNASCSIPCHSCHANRNYMNMMNVLMIQVTTQSKI